MSPRLSRRVFFRTSVVAVGSLGMVGATRADSTSGTDEFRHEVVRSPEEWLARLGEHDFRILRLGETEVPESSEIWDETREGAYHCKGCELHVYESEWKVPLDKGWAFFRHSVPNSLLMGIDWADGAGPNMGADALSTIEVHCRRCGGHMGHILLVEGSVLHCINGASLEFRPQLT